MFGGHHENYMGHGIDHNLPAGKVGFEIIISVACKVRRMLFGGGAAALLKFDIVAVAGKLLRPYQISV